MDKKITPYTSIEVCTLMAHETVALLDAADDGALDAAREFRTALEVICTMQNMGEDGKALLAWVDAEIENTEQFAATGQDAPHLIDLDQLLSVPDAESQLTAVWTLFETAAMDGCDAQSRQMLLNAARMLTEMGGLDDLILTVMQRTDPLTAAELRQELADVHTALQANAEQCTGSTQQEMP